MADDVKPGSAPSHEPDAEAAEKARLDAVRRRFLINSAKLGALAPVVLTIGSRSALAAQSHRCSLYAGGSHNCPTDYIPP